MGPNHAQILILPLLPHGKNTTLIKCSNVFFINDQFKYYQFFIHANFMAYNYYLITYYNSENIKIICQLYRNKKDK
jgi:hypothetical protein